MFGTGCWGTYQGETYDVITKKEHLEELFRCIEANILTRQKEIDRLHEELKYTKDEAYKDKELAELKAQNDKLWETLRHSYIVEEDEYNKICEWQKKHDEIEHKEMGNHRGAVGGGYSYVFYPTSIGTFWHCECDICKRKAMDAAYASGTYNGEVYKKYMEEHNGQINFDDV